MILFGLDTEISSLPQAGCSDLRQIFGDLAPCVIRSFWHSESMVKVMIWVEKFSSTQQDMTCSV